ncbi:probable protein arginine N-methyltransferase 1.2 isoform X1 [Drosophila subobscura]|uniref:probable protein arginine N-methyltransferase 1.2 isoform X1 n=1 Tax=Drosophila subobscura TaxID=7241 RepID=UPI00155A3C05|nr:probable protein arginine N-methyltransferase 1.2 isoform X1 [Drosophila subobscura]
MKYNVQPVVDLDLLELAEIEMGIAHFPMEIDDEVFILNEELLDENRGLTYEGTDDANAVEVYSDVHSEDNNGRGMEEQSDDIADMVMDEKTSDAFGKFIKSNLELFKDKIILDVGCCCGVLSQHCILAGAAMVIATGNQNAARYVLALALDHGIEDVFYPVKGDISEIELPMQVQHVDVIVSEWTGASEFVGSRLQDVIYARDKWLVKGGLIFPNVGQLFITGLYDNPITYTEGYQAAKVEDSEDHSTPSSDSDSGEANVGQSPQIREYYVGPVDVVTQKYLLKTVDLQTLPAAEAYISSEFKLRMLDEGPFVALSLHSDICVSLPNRKLKRLFSTGPTHPETYLLQTVLVLDNAHFVTRETQLKGVLSLRRNSDDGIEYSLHLRGDQLVTDLLAELSLGDDFYLEILESLPSLFGEERMIDSLSDETDFYVGIESLALLFSEQNSEVNVDQDTDSVAEAKHQ